MSRSNLNSDWGYYNFIINNSTNDFITAEFQETRINPVLTNMQDWEMSVIRFKIPSTAIPLFIFEEDLLPPPALPGTYLSPYWVGYSIGPTYTTPLIQNVAFDPFFANNTLTNRPQSRFIYYYSAFIQMINVALGSLNTTARANGAYALSGILDFSEHEFPFIELDDTTPYMKFMLPYDDNFIAPSPFVFDITDNINIHMSKKLFYFFAGFNARLLSTPPLPNMDYVLKFAPPILYNNIIDLPKWGNNPTLPLRKVLQVYQDYSCLYLWSTLSRIVLTTNIPIEQEYIGVAGADGQNFQQTLLTDFEIEPNRDGNQRDYIYYFSDAPRYSNFTSNGDLRHMDLRVFYQTRDLRTFPLVIPPTFELSVKIQFRRRRARSQLQYSEVGKFNFNKH